MRRSDRLFLGLLWAALLSVYSIDLYGQNITYQNPSSFFACDLASFSVTVQNTSGATMANVAVTVNFTTTNGTPCSIQYQQGSVSSGVSEGNISNLSAPQFILPNLPAGASQSFTIMANADCQTAACIDNAEVFVNNINLSWTGGNTSITTNPYVVDRALLVITAVNNTVMQGIRGDILHRKITVRNTRPGALSSFTFTDGYQPGLSISSTQGTVVASIAGLFSAQFGASDFTAIGDGDGLFEFNESIEIVEDILITTCGVDESSAVSNITVGWGCENATCQQELVNAVVTFKVYDKAPLLDWEPILSVPECFCGPDAHRQGMKITNVGTGSALNISMVVAPNYGFLPGAIDTSSIVVDSLNFPIGFQKIYFSNFDFPSPCEAPTGLTSSMNIVIFNLEPGASVTVFWDLYFCSYNGCEQPNVGWTYDYSYFKECPPSIFIENDKPIEVSKKGLTMNTSANIIGNDPMEDGGTYTIGYVVNYDSLALLDASLTLDIELPCGFEFVPTNAMLMNGQVPADLSVNVTDTVTYITAVYDLPLASNTGEVLFDVIFDCDAICKDGIVCEFIEVSTCDEDCPIDFEPTYGGNVRTTLSKCSSFPLECNIQSCIQFDKEYDCPIDSVCVDAPPGYLHYGFSALRKNYGLPDNDNNQIPDAPSGSPNLGLVARDHFIAGDTIQTIFRGEVVIDKPGATLPYGLLQVGLFGGSMMSQQNRATLFLPNNLTEAGSLLRIFDKSSGNWYDCANPAYTTDIQLRYSYDLSQAIATCLPPGFAFDEGDSLVFVGNYRIGYNPIYETDGTPLLGNIIVEPKVFLFDADTSAYTEINCQCSHGELFLSRYDFSIIPQTFGLSPCEPSEYATSTLIRLNLHEGNFFPFEHRNIMVWDDLRIQVPPSVQLLTTRMTLLRLQTGIDIALQQLFTPSLVNGEYFHDLLPYQTPPLDEGFYAQIQFIFKSDCTNQFAMPMTYTTTLDFAPGLPEPDDPLNFTLSVNSLRPLIPNLNIGGAPLFDLTSFTNQLVFDFKLQNTPTIVGNLTSGPSLNTWMYVTSQTGLVTNLQLLDALGQPVPSINGVWQLGDLPENPDGFPFTLLGTNNSCQLENLQIHYGWNCVPMTSTVQAPCYEQVQPISIESPPGEIDMIVTSPTGCSALCDTIPYHTIEVFNAQLGSVYDLRVKALLPPGMAVIPGSCEVEYPTGSNNYYPIGDPTLIGTGVVEWNLSVLFDSLAAGLAGVGEAPYNSLTLRFLGETTCDFIADAYVLFIASAKQNCGLPTNSIAKPGDPLCIDGVSGPYTTNINVNAVPGFGCNNEVGFEVSLTASATLPPGACLIVTLPSGITYDIGSCTNECATGFNCSPTINGSFVTWQLPTGVLANQIICFKFNTQGWAGLGCENGVVLFRTAAQTQALCALTGDTCSTKVSTGSLILPFDPMRPEYVLSNFMVTATSAGANDLIDFTINVFNNGAPNQPPLEIGIFVDTDGDGDGDQLVFTATSNAVISNGQGTTVSGSFSIPKSNLCKLLAVIDPAQQCACSGDVEQAGVPIVYETGIDLTTCSGTDLPIGVPPIPGFDYQWTPDDCLDPSQLQSATAVFNCLNNGTEPVSYEFVLAEGNGFCEIQNQIDVTVQPEPGIVYFDSPICIGESANLVATDGVNYNWQGPGITAPNMQIQVVTPTTASQYTVSVVDAFGCMGIDTATVLVLPQPIADAGNDTTFCPGELAMLNAYYDLSYDYIWSPATLNGLPTLSDPTIHNPIVLVNQPISFVLTINSVAAGCSAMDTINVFFADSLVIVMPADITICAGSSATLTATASSPAVFTWSPDGNCANPPSCSSWTVSPAVTTTYTAVANGADGCNATGMVTVTVVTDQLVETDTLEICEGETIVINGETVSQAGIYCDTFMVGGDCDSLYCIELLVKPALDSVLLDSTICMGDSVVFGGEVYTQSGKYCVTLPSTTGCDTTQCLQLTVLPLPSIELTVMLDSLVVDTIGIGDTVSLSIPPGNYTSILWYANDTLLAACTNSISCQHVPADSVTYSVVVSLDGCSGTAEQFVYVLPACSPNMVEVPNAFSPNDDMVNDRFNIVGPGKEAILNMRIWNRWGQKVYDGPGPWDGSQDGKPAASDVYIYIVKVGCAVFVEDMERVLKGDVTLMR